MAITRIKNNQITDATIVASAKLVDNTVTSGKLAENLVYPSNLTVQGNLLVNGTTTTINTTNTTVEDPILVLGSLQTGTPALDFGFIGERGTDTNVAFIWDEETDEWIAGFTTSAESSTSINISAMANFRAGNIAAEGTFSAASLSTTGDLTVQGLADLNGNVEIAGSLDVDGLTNLDAVSISETLGVAGNASFSTLSSSGLASLDSISVTDNVAIGGTLDVDGLTTTDGITNDGAISTTTLAVTNGATVGSTLAVTGASTFENDITIDGGSGIDFIITDGAGTTFSVNSQSGNTTVGGTLNVTGTSTLGVVNAGATTVTTLDATSNVDIDGTLNVGSAATFAAISGGPATLTSAKISDLTQYQVVVPTGVDGELGGYTSLTFNGTELAVGVTNFTVASTTGNTAIAGTLDVNGQATLASANVEDLTATHIVFAGTNGELEGSANLAFTGTALDLGVALEVAGTSTFDDTITLNGGALKNFVITDGTTTTFSVESSTGNTTVHGTGDFTVTGGDASFGAGVTVTGTTELNGQTNVANFAVDNGATVTMGSNVVGGVATPSAGTDAANKDYVDAQVAAGGAVLKIAGDTGTDNVTLGVANDTFSVVGTTNEIETAVTDNQVQIGLPDSVSITTNLTAGGDVSADNVIATTNVSTSALSTTSLATLNSASVTTTLGVTGESTFENNVTINGGSGEIFKVTDGAVTPTNLFTINNENGNVYVGGTFEVDGAADLNDGLNVDGATTLDALTADGATTINNTLNVTGISTLGVTNTGVLTAASGSTTSNWTVGGALAVTGGSTLTGALVANNTADFNGAVTMDDITFDLGAVINMGGNVVSGVASPLLGTDAVNRDYVETQLNNFEWTLSGELLENQALIGNGDTVKVVGTANEVDISWGSELGATVLTFGLPNDVTIGNDLTVTADLIAATATISGLTDLNGNLDVLGTSTFTGDMTTGNVSTTGTLTVTGQANIDDLVINGSTIESTSASGIIYIDPYPAGGDTGGEVRIVGNLTVLGTTTTINSTTVQIDDAITTLGPTDYSNTTLDSGVKMFYNDGADKEAFMGLDHSADEIVFYTDATDTAGVISGTLGAIAAGSARVTDLTTDRIVIVGAAGELEDDANFTFDGTTMTVPNITMTGDLSLDNLTVTGTSDLQGAVDVGSTLDVVGATTLNSTLSAGASTLASATINGAATVGDTFGVTGASTLSTVTATDIDADTLDTTGAVTVGGTLDVTGISTLADVDAANIDSDTLDTTGNVTVGGTLDVTGATTLNDNVTIAGGNGEIFKVTDGATNDLFIIDANNGNVTVDDGAFVANGTADFNGLVTLGSFTVDGGATIDMGDNVVGGVATPVANTDAVNKAYVDTLVGGGFDIVAGTNGSGGPTTIAGGDDLTVNGVAGEIEITVGADALTIGLPDNVSVTGTLGTGGLATLHSLDVTNGATVGGALGVTGTSTLGVVNAGATTVTTLTASAAANFQTTANVTSTLTVGGQLNANGGINADSGAFTVADTTGDVATTGSLTVGSGADITGTTLLDDVDVSGTADITGNTTVGGTLGVTGAATFQTDVTIVGGSGDTFTITNGAATTLFEVNAETGQVDATAINVSGNFDVNGDTTVDNFEIGGGSTVSMGSNVVTNVGTPLVGTDAVNLQYITDNVLNVGWTLSDGITDQDVLIGDTVTLEGTPNEIEVNVSSPDTMTIGLPDDVTISGNLTVNTNATVTGTLDVDGTTTTDGITNDGNIGTTTLSTTGLATLNSATVSTTLGVTGESTFTALTTHNGGLTTTTAAVTDLTDGRVVLAGTGGELEDSGNLTFDGSTLTVTGDVDASGDLGGDTATIVGNATVGGTLGVVGNTTVSTGTFTVSTGATSLQATGVTGVLTVTGSAAIDNVTIDGNDISATAGTELTINDAGGDYNFRIEGNTDENLVFVDAGTDSVNIGTATALTDVQFQVGGTTSVVLSKGTTAERPVTGIAGMLRYNTTTDEYEYYDGSTSQWSSFGTEFTIIASETFAGDDVTVAFTLSSSQTTASCIVSINGVVQVPTTAYGVSGTTLTFTEAPATGDVIEVRQLTTTTSIEGVSDGVASITTQGAAGLEVTGDLIPAADDTYALGSASRQWSELHVAGSTIYLGGLQIKNDAGTFKFLQSNGIDPAPAEFTLDPDITVDGGTF
jgi:hypothetical protein